MSALKVSPEMLVKSLRRHADTQANAKAWLIETQNTARTAWMNGDEYATSVSTEGGSTGWLRGITATDLDQLCELAIQQIEVEEAAEAAGEASGGPGALKHADFSRERCVMG